MRTEAAMLSNIEEINLVSLQLPQLRSKDILVEVEVTGLCGSDMAVYLGKHGYKKPPIVLGHEFSGIARHVGEAVTSVKVGDRICAASFASCERCDDCLRGSVHLCRNKRNISTGDWHGSFASYVNVTEGMVTVLPLEIDAEKGALVEPLTIGLHAMRLAPAMADRKVVIIGAGSIGLACLIAAKRLGAGRIVCIDRGPLKRSIALRLGADEVVDAQSEDVVSGTLEAIDQQADITVIACGYGDVFSHARRLTRPGGDVIVVSHFDPDVRIDPNEFVRAEIAMRFSYLSTQRDFDEVIGWISHGGLDPTPLITHRVPLSQADFAFKLKKDRSPDVGKVIFDLSRNAELTRAVPLAESQLDR
jgi:threonine dehydrogenase-like Zn-dependent dehydrogenase